MVDAATTLVGMAWTEGATVLARLGYQWNVLGERDALGAVLTRSNASPEWNEHDFFQTGLADVGRLMTDIARRAPWVATRRALDFGCGIWRITLALSGHFVEVHGVDVARSTSSTAASCCNTFRRSSQGGIFRSLSGCSHPAACWCFSCPR